MSGESGSSSQVISLPKGGGALHGIGEKFSPDLHTGTGNFTVPLALPPGRNGFQPKIDLVYSTGHGNGPFGLGWALSLPGITRKTSKGIPRYRDYASKLEELDTFILSGTEDLVPISDPTQSPTLYRPRTEGLLLRSNTTGLKTATTGLSKAKTASPAIMGLPNLPTKRNGSIRR